MDCNMPGFPVLHHLLEFAQIHGHWVGDAILSSHPPLPHPHPQSFSASGSFPISLLFTSGGQRIGASASASVLPVNIQGWFPLELTGLISLQSKGLSSLLQHHSSKSSVLWCSAFFMVQLSYLYMTTGKTIDLTIQTFVGKVMSLCFNMLSKFIIAFFPRYLHLKQSKFLCKWRWTFWMHLKVTVFAKSSWTHFFYLLSL